MSEQQATTPTDVATEQSLDSKIAEKFGFSETEEPQEQPDSPPAEDAATDEPMPDDGEPEIEPEEEAPTDSGEEFELIHDGKQVRVSKEQARNLAQQGYDYSQKMEKLRVDYTRVQGMATALQAQATMQPQFVDAIGRAKAYELAAQQYANTDWVREAAEDPLGVIQKREHFNQLQSGWQQAMNQAQQIADGMGKAQEQVSSEQLAVEAQRLLERVPQWRDEKVATKERQEISRALTSDYGFTQDELARWGNLFSDHRVIALLRDGAKYRQAVVKGKQAKGSLQGLPQVPKPGQRAAPQSRTASLAEAKRNLRQSTSKEARNAWTDKMLAIKFGVK